VAIGVKARKTHDPHAPIETYYAPVVISETVNGGAGFPKIMAAMRSVR
jgi:hypothetical protein